MLPGVTTTFADPVTDWSRYFAWRPIRTWDGRWRFLCWTERRRMVAKDYLFPPTGDWWQYRLMLRIKP